jgi:hypothetical protein
MENSKVIDSYKDSFKSPLGAYVYMQLNQRTPEFFVVSSKGPKELSSQFEDILTITTDFNSLMAALKSLPEEPFKILQEENVENDLTKATMLRSVGNLKYLGIDFNSKDAWNELNGFIEYNAYTEFIKDKEPLQQKLREHVEKFSLASFSLNPNFNPDEFLDKFEKGINSMCEVLKIEPKQIGLKTLNLNYKTEDGDFTGYVGIDYVNTPDNNISCNKMVINKPEVFAHEWMHFLESNLAIHQFSFTQIMGHELVEKFKRVMPEYDELFKFKDALNQKESAYSEKSLSSSVKSAAHFYERYAIDSNNFNSNIETICDKFEINFKEGKSKEECLEVFESSIKALLQEPHPPRYFSFLKAQCDLYMDRANKQSLEKNQYMDFAKKSDQYLQIDDYTQSLVETFARSFEAFVAEKLKPTGKECCLVSASYDSDFYPQGEMKEKMNSLWDGMWSQLKAGLDKEMPVNPNAKIDKSFIKSNIMAFREKFMPEKSKEQGLKMR